jgi:hypothetical protein
MDPRRIRRLVFVGDNVTHGNTGRSLGGDRLITVDCPATCPRRRDPVYDRNDAAVELEAEAGQRSTARRGRSSSAACRPGDHVPRWRGLDSRRSADRDVGQATDFPFHVGESIVHSDHRLAVRYEVDVFG